MRYTRHHCRSTVSNCSLPTHASNPLLFLIFSFSLTSETCQLCNLLCQALKTSGYGDGHEDNFEIYRKGLKVFVPTESSDFPIFSIYMHLGRGNTEYFMDGSTWHSFRITLTRQPLISNLGPPTYLTMEVFTKSNYSRNGFGYAKSLTTIQQSRYAI